MGKEENSVTLELDRKKFAKLQTGARVKGYVSVVLTKPTQSQSISLKLSTQPGNEWVKESGGKVKQEYRGGGRVFQIVIPLEVFSEREMTGNFRFPFEFQVPVEDPNGRPSVIKLPRVLFSDIRTYKGDTLTEKQFPPKRSFLPSATKAPAELRPTEMVAFRLDDPPTTFDPPSAQAGEKNEKSCLLDPQDSVFTDPSPKHAVRYSIVERPVLLYLPELENQFQRIWNKRLQAKYVASRTSDAGTDVSGLHQHPVAEKHSVAIGDDEAVPNEAKDPGLAGGVREPAAPAEPRDQRTLRYVRAATPLYLTDSLWKSGATLPGAPQMRIPLILPPMIVPQTTPSPLARIGGHAMTQTSGANFTNKLTMENAGAFVMGLPPLQSATLAAAAAKESVDLPGQGEGEGEGEESGGHIDICCELKTNAVMPGETVELIVSMQNLSKYEVQRVFVEVIKRNLVNSSLMGTGETLAVDRETLVNQYRFDHVRDFVNSTALVHVKLPPYIDPSAEYLLQARVQLKHHINPFCRIPLAFSTVQG